MTGRNSDVEFSQIPLWNQHCLVTFTVLMGIPPCSQASFSQWLFIHYEHHGWRGPCSKNPLLDLQNLSSNQCKEVFVSGNIFINFAVLKIRWVFISARSLMPDNHKGGLLEPGIAALCTLTWFLHYDLTQPLALTLFSAMGFTFSKRGNYIQQSLEPNSSQKPDLLRRV